MGLSGRKVKQRIGADPRNLTWADDAAKFGQSYLSKFGWDPSQGLGLQGDGRTSHIKVAQKLNLMGIGAGAQTAGPESLAWKQNREYEILLKRLNESNAVAVDSQVEEPMEAVAQTASSETEQKRKRKKEKGVEDDSKKKKKRKKSSEERESAEAENLTSKLDKTVKDKVDGDLVVTTVTETVETAATPSRIHVPRPMAHRARFLASKRQSAMPSNAAAISEILGVAPSTSASSSSTPIPPGTPSVLTAASSSQGELTLEQLSTSTKSVADYFKEKLAVRAGGTTTKSPTASEPPSRDIIDAAEESREAPRQGLGARSALASSFTPRTNIDEQDAPRAGLGSTRANGNFLSFIAASSATTVEPEHPAKATEEDDGEGREKKDKKKKKKIKSEGDADESKAKRKRSKSEKEPESQSAAAEIGATGLETVDGVAKKGKKSKTSSKDPVDAIKEGASEDAEARKTAKERKREKKEKKKKRRGGEDVDGVGEGT